MREDGILNAAVCFNKKNCLNQPIFVSNVLEHTEYFVISPLEKQFQSHHRNDRELSASYLTHQQLLRLAIPDFPFAHKSHTNHP